MCACVYPIFPGLVDILSFSNHETRRLSHSSFLRMYGWYCREISVETPQCNLADASPCTSQSTEAFEMCLVMEKGTDIAELLSNFAPSSYSSSVSPQRTLSTPTIPHLCGGRDKGHEGGVSSHPLEPIKENLLRVASGLAFMHDSLIFHRDLRAETVVVCSFIKMILDIVVCPCEASGMWSLISNTNCACR